MEDELGAEERRYIEAYLELESQSTAAPAGARERVLAAAFAEVEPRRREAAPRRSLRGVLIGAGLCAAAAAAAMAWWVGRASLVEEHALRVHDQAPLVTHGERAVHETSTTSRGAATEPTQSSAPNPASPVVNDRTTDPPRPTPAATDPTVDPRSPAASTKRAEAPGSARRRVEPNEPTPTLSDAEVALLERARRLTQAGEHGAALAVLREHAQSYPGSVLGPERTAEQVAVLCRMGAESAASARASFMAGDPPQYLRSRVEKACTP